MNYDYSWTAIFRPDKATDFFTPCFDLKEKGKFQVKTSEYSSINAWRLSEISRLIYRPGKNEIKTTSDFIFRNDFLDKAGFEEYRTFNIGTNRCAIFVSTDKSNDDFAVAAFRGTLELTTWFTNLNAIPAEWHCGGSVHRGFRNAFYELWNKVEHAVSSLKIPIYYTGHSLGAALATLAASERPPRAVYTFGSPRVGDTFFAHTLKDVKIFRVKNGSDIVTHLPPPYVFSEFCHVGELHAVKNELSNNQEHQGTNFRHELKRFMGPPPYMSDHAPVNYSVCLEKSV